MCRSYRRLALSSVFMYISINKIQFIKINIAILPTYKKSITVSNIIKIQRIHFRY